MKQSVSQPPPAKIGGEESACETCIKLLSGPVCACSKVGCRSSADGGRGGGGGGGGGPPAMHPRVAWELYVRNQKAPAALALGSGPRRPRLYEVRQTAGRGGGFRWSPLTKARAKTLASSASYMESLASGQRVRVLAALVGCTSGKADPAAGTAFLEVLKSIGEHALARAMMSPGEEEEKPSKVDDAGPRFISLQAAILDADAPRVARMLRDVEEGRRSRGTAGVLKRRLAAAVLANDPELFDRVFTVLGRERRRGEQLEVDLESFPALFATGSSGGSGLFQGTFYDVAARTASLATFARVVGKGRPENKTRFSNAELLRWLSALLLEGARYRNWPVVEFLLGVKGVRVVERAVGKPTQSAAYYVVSRFAECRADPCYARCLHQLMRHFLRRPELAELKAFGGSGMTLRQFAASPKRDWTERDDSDLRALLLASGISSPIIPPPRPLAV